MIRDVVCTRAPRGWRCASVEGHDGPCALVRSGLRGWLVSALRGWAATLERG